jgi:sulfonate transport system substrate-binding protein
MKTSFVHKGFALILALSLTALSACGSSAASTTSDAAEAAKSSAEAAASTTTESAAAETTTTSDGEIDLSGVTLRVWGSSYNYDLLKAAGVDDYPYTLEYDSYSGGSLALQAMAIDELDLSATSEIPPLYAALTDGGGNFKIIANNADSTLLQDLIVGPDSTAQSVADLKGQKVGYVEATTAHYFLAKMLEADGLSWTDIEPVALTPSDGLAALLSGEIAAFAVFGPQIYSDEEAGGRVLASAENILSGNYCYCANVRSLDDPAKRAAIIDYLTRWEQVNQWKVDHIEEYCEITKDYSGMELDEYISYITDCVNQQPSQIKVISDDSIASQQDVADTLYGLGVLESPVDVASIYSDELSEELGAALDAIGK